VIKIISSAKYEELVSGNETLGDRVRYLESKLSNADNAMASLEKSLKDALAKSGLITELESEIQRSQEANTVLGQDLDQAQESIANLQKAIAEVKQKLSESQIWIKQLEGLNKNQVETIAKFLKQCDEVELERNALIVENGLSKVELENYRRNVAIAVDNLQIEIKKPFLSEAA
jgi:predicted  nucleic acid-binding Zn-ribbon protein